MHKLYEATGNMMVPCACGDQECEVEIDTHFGLDIPWHITHIPKTCPSTFERFTVRDMDVMIRKAYDMHEKEMERNFDSQYTGEDGP